LIRLKSLKKEYYDKKNLPHWEILNDMAKNKNKGIITKTLEEKKVVGRKIDSPRTRKQAGPPKHSEGSS